MSPAVFRLLVVTVGAEVLLGVGLALTHARPRVRFWPPPGIGSWQFWAAWVLTGVAALGTAALGVLAWTPDASGPVVRYASGGLLVSAGLALAAWGLRTLGPAASAGLVTDGPYRFTRNPQYLGDLLVLAGWALLTGSGLVWAVALLAGANLYLAARVEERWLEIRFGQEYRRYRDAVPRFL